MVKVLSALKKSFQALISTRMLLVMVIPPLIAVVALLLIFFFFWSSWVTGLSGFISSSWFFGMIQKSLQVFGDTSGMSEIAFWLAVVFLILGFLPLAFLLAILITSIFVMPLVLELVVRSDFADLEKKHGGSFAGSLWNAAFATVVFIILFMMTLPLWLVPGLQILIPVLLTAWLNKKIFVYDVLQDFASKDERKQIETQERANLYGMGSLLGLLAYVPLAFLLIPVLSALSYTYYCLDELKRLRSGTK
jgi:hypothetical protein